MNFKDCFISYSHKDEEKVVEIVNCLRERGYSVLMDTLFSAGENWNEKAREYVFSTKCTIIFLSDNSIVSYPVFQELSCAEKESKRAGYHYFSVLLDNEPIREKYKKLKRTIDNVQQLMIASDIYDLLPDECIYILNDRNVIENICDSLNKYGIFPLETTKSTVVTVAPSASESYSLVSFEKEISAFSIHGDEKILTLKNKNFADLGGENLYRIVLLPINTAKVQINSIFAKEICFFDFQGNSIFHEYLNSLDCNYSENVLERNYNCINIDFLMRENIFDLLRKTKIVKLKLEIESVHSKITSAEYDIYLNKIKSNEDNVDVKEIGDLLTFSIHHVKTYSILRI